MHHFYIYSHYIIYFFVKVVLEGVLYKMPESSREDALAREANVTYFRRQVKNREALVIPTERSKEDKLRSLWQRQTSTAAAKSSERVSQDFPIVDETQKYTGGKSMPVRDFGIGHKTLTYHDFHEESNGNEENNTSPEERKESVIVKEENADPQDHFNKSFELMQERSGSSGLQLKTMANPLSHRRNSIAVETVARVPVYNETTEFLLTNTDLNYTNYADVSGLQSTLLGYGGAFPHTAKTALLGIGEETNEFPPEALQEPMPEIDIRFLSSSPAGFNRERRRSCPNNAYSSTRESSPLAPGKTLSPPSGTRKRASGSSGGRRSSTAGLELRRQSISRSSGFETTSKPPQKRSSQTFTEEDFPSASPGIANAVKYRRASIHSVTSQASSKASMGLPWEGGNEDCYFSRNSDLSDLQGLENTLTLQESEPIVEVGGEELLASGASAVPSTSNIASPIDDGYRLVEAITSPESLLSELEESSPVLPKANALPDVAELKACSSSMGDHLSPITPVASPGYELGIQDMSGSVLLDSVNLDGTCGGSIPPLNVSVAGLDCTNSGLANMGSNMGLTDPSFSTAGGMPVLGGSDVYEQEQEGNEDFLSKLDLSLPV